MAKATIAHPAHPVPPIRLERGWALYSEYASEIVSSYSQGIWLIPSQFDGTSVYEIRLGRNGSDCECRHFEHRGERCKHIIAARYAAANSECCAFCGQRFPYGELQPVDNDHYLGLGCRECL